MDNRSPVGVCEKKHTEGASGDQYTESWLSLPVFFPAVTLSNYLPRRKDVRLPSGKKAKSEVICVVKNPMKKALRNPFSKSAHTTKSANSTATKVLIRQLKKCRFDKISAQTTM